MTTTDKPPTTDFRGRSAARLAAVQALYQLEQGDIKTAEQIVQEFITHRIGKTIEDVDYFAADSTLFQNIVIGSSEQQEEIDRLIASTLSQVWRLERLESVVRAILRAGCYELMKSTDVPVPIIIDEYVEITKAFYDGKEASFVNGALDTLAKLLRQ